MTIVYWIIFGFIAGSIANFIAPRAYGGIAESIALGIIGAIVGGFFGKRYFGVEVTGFNIKSFVIAISGALLFLFAGILFRG